MAVKEIGDSGVVEAQQSTQYLDVLLAEWSEVATDSEKVSINSCWGK